jgi:hypothetical protein
VRGSGRTKRLLEAAVDAAFEGKNVVFYVGVVPMVEYSRKLAQHIAKAPINMSGRSPAFDGTLKCVFLSASNLGYQNEVRAGHECGIKDLVVMYDHYFPLRGGGL